MHRSASVEEMPVKWSHFIASLMIGHHQMRHGFTVHMLALLIRQRFGEADEDQEISGDAYRRLLGDPLQEVQRMVEVDVARGNGRMANQEAVA
jgi:hypothetical protein